MCALPDQSDLSSMAQCWSMLNGKLYLWSDSLKPPCDLYQKVQITQK